MGLPKSRVDEMLHLVSLTADEATRRLRHYSLGMKQRLGIAHALLGDPQVLILDEPANGLDPAGIRWMRGLLKGYADRGGTVLLSSHLLHEVELIADEMILIGRGRIVAQGDKKSLLVEPQDQAQVPRAVTSLDDERLAGVLREKGVAVTAGPQGLTVAVRERRRRPRRRRAPDRADRPALGRGRPGGPLPRAHLRHPARGHVRRTPAGLPPQGPPQGFRHRSAAGHPARAARRSAAAPGPPPPGYPPPQPPAPQPGGPR